MTDGPEEVDALEEAQEQGRIAQRRQRAAGIADDEDEEDEDEWGDEEE